MVDNVRFNFLYIDTYSFGRNWVFPESAIPYNMFRYIESGTGTFFIDDEEFTAEKDHIVYIPRGSRLSCYALTDNFTFTSIRFTTSVYFEGGDFLADYYNIPKIIACENEKRYFEEMYYWIKQENPARMFLVRGYLELLIGTLIARANGDGTIEKPHMKQAEEYNLEKIHRRIRKSGNKIDPRIQGVVDYILLHPAEQYTPQRMADMAGLSKQRFSCLFKEQLGKSPMAYIKELKLTTAARKLLVSSENISDIAYEVGYEDPNYFIREFKKAFGYTPRRYRQEAKE
ncbi:MAG: AraC family transcriptional regulator [Lachnospiraceae bacterium]|nr:AraC family transcriptional regulator [Lachnospiraceae bacterium]